MDSAESANTRSSECGWGAEFAHQLQQQRSRIQSSLQGERDRIRRTELTLSTLVEQIEEELASRESSWLQEITNRNDEITRLTDQLEEQRSQFDLLMAEALELYRPSPEVEEELQRLREALVSSTTKLEEQSSEIDGLRQDLSAIQQQPTIQSGPTPEILRELELLLEERDRLVQERDRILQERNELVRDRDNLQLALREAKEQPSESNAPDPQKLEELRRHLEVSLAELNEAKNRNAELEQQLSRKSRIAVSPTLNEGNDWESQKRRLLAQLEADEESESPEAVRERLAIEEVIRTTDQIIAEKNREVRELYQTLEAQSAKVGELAVGANAIAGLLDQDELICQQREALKKLENEWCEKLRSAEVDLSMERAKIARERALLQEQIQQYESERAKGPKASKGDAEKPGAQNKGTKGRWLSRLGLSDDEAR